MYIFPLPLFGKEIGVTLNVATGLFLSGLQAENSIINMILYRVVKGWRNGSSGRVPA
jgi:hypothetical protein